VLEVWTDGTITGTESVSAAAGLLMDQLTLLRSLAKPQPAIVERGLAWRCPFARPLQHADRAAQLSVRAYNRSEAQRPCMTVGQVLEKSETTSLPCATSVANHTTSCARSFIQMDFLQSEPEGEMVGAYDEEEEGQRIDGRSGAALIQALRKAGEDLPPGEIEEEGEEGEESPEEKEE
jgi:hypothetical protein